ncbi:MAG: hypothetical protein K6C94_02785 [Candidatus Gastranaerophilales bacterium]|nr:hypothetical protein [Candidatus Gastranaerophilales bacterium]
MRKILILLFLFCGLSVLADAHYPAKYNHDKNPGQYPQEMIMAFGKARLDNYFSLPENERNDIEINQWGDYSVDFNGPALNSKYAPDTIISPFVPKWQRDRAAYYFEQGLKMQKR